MPVKSTVASRLCLVDADPDLDDRALIGNALRFAVGQPVEHAAHAFVGVVLNVAHIGLDHFKRKHLDHAPELPHALFVSGDLGLEVVDVLQRIARRIGAASQQVIEFALAEAPALDQEKIVDIDALFKDRRGERRHRSRRRSADVGVMAARGGPEQDRSPMLVEDRRADRDVGQMGAAVIGRVEREHIARANAPLIVADDRLDRTVHRAQMHRHVRSVGDEAPLAVEQCAGKVEPLLDVDRIGGVLQRDAHLLGDRHEEMIEDLEHDRIGFGADRLAPRHRLDASHQHVVFRRDRGAPALFHDDRLMRLDDQRRPIDLRAGAKRFTQKDIRVSPATMRKEARRAGGNRRRGR